MDPAVSTQASRAAHLLRSQAGEGTLDLMLLNAQHGVLILEDSAGDTSTVHTLPGHHCCKSRQALYHVLQTHTATRRAKRGGWKAMAARTSGETTPSGGSATGGICRNNTFHQPTHVTSSQLYSLRFLLRFRFSFLSQLYHNKQHKDRHPIQLARPTTI